MSTSREAIALVYDGGEQAPTITAKGEGDLAQQIIDLAMQYEVPIYENAELTRMLARMELGDQIPEALYRTIAEIIAFESQCHEVCVPLHNQVLHNVAPGQKVALT